MKLQGVDNMDKIKKFLICLLIVFMTFGTVNPQSISIVFAEAIQQECTEGVLSEDGTYCEDVPKEEIPLECKEGVLSEDGTYCEDVPTDEPIENNNGTGNGETTSPPVETPTDTESLDNPSDSSNESSNNTELNNSEEANSALPNINLPEGLELTEFSSAEMVIDLNSDSNSNNSGTESPQQFTIPSNVLQQLSDLMQSQQSEGRQTLVFRTGEESNASLDVPADALIYIRQSNPNLFINFSTEMGSSGFSPGNLNEQQLRRASSIGTELTSANLPQQQGSSGDFRNAVRFTNFIIEANGRRTVINPVLMNFFPENSINIQRPSNQLIVSRYDEILNSWVPVPNWNQNEDPNRLTFTGTFSGVYGPIPPRQLNFNDINGLPPAVSQLIGSGIVNGNANGALNLNQDLTLNQGLTLITRTLGLEAGDPTTGLPNTSVAGGSMSFAGEIGLLNNISGDLQANSPLPIGDFVQMMNNGLNFSANQNGANLQINNPNSSTNGETNSLQSGGNSNSIPGAQEDTNQTPSTYAVVNNTLGLDLTALQVNNTLGADVLNMSNLQSMDLDTAVMAVQSNRASLLDNQLKAQLDSVQQRNQQISELNDAINNARNIESKLDSDQMAAADYAQLKQLIQQLNIRVEGTGPDANKRALEKIKDTAKSQIDGLSNSQQMDVLRLQSLSNKRNEAFDLMTNFLKKMQANRSSIIGNMR